MFYFSGTSFVAQNTHTAHNRQTVALMILHTWRVLLLLTRPSLQVSPNVVRIAMEQNLKCFAAAVARKGLRILSYVFFSSFLILGNNMASQKQENRGRLFHTL